MKTRNYREDLLKRLKSKSYATKLLRKAFSESCKDGDWEAFGIILKDIIEDQGNKQQFAESANISRQHLYRLFKKDANPTLKTLLPVLAELGLELEVKTKGA